MKKGTHRHIAGEECRAAQEQISTDPPDLFGHKTSFERNAERDQRAKNQ